MLGEFKGVGERGELQFELEANYYNKELDSKNFMDGETGAKFAIEPPGFFQNLISGGKLQGEWEEKMKQMNSAAAPSAQVAKKGPVAKRK